MSDIFIIRDCWEVANGKLLLRSFSSLVVYSLFCFSFFILGRCLYGGIMKGRLCIP